MILPVANILPRMYAVPWSSVPRRLATDLAAWSSAMAVPFSSFARQRASASCDDCLWDAKDLTVFQPELDDDDVEVVTTVWVG